MKKVLKFSIIFLIWISIWYLLSFFHALIYDMDLSNNLLLPYPHQVISKLFVLLTKGNFYLSTASSLLRIIISTVLAIVFGVLFAILCSKLEFLHDFLKPFLAAIERPGNGEKPYPGYPESPGIRRGTAAYNSSRKRHRL